MVSLSHVPGARRAMVAAGVALAALAAAALPAAGARAATAPPAAVDLTAARAQWIDRTTLAWDAPPAPGASYELDYRSDGGIAVRGTALTGTDPRLRLRLAARPGGLTERQRKAFPQLSRYQAFTVDPRDRDRIVPALRGQLLAVQRDAAGSATAATGVQTPGVLDDLYAAAARRSTLGPAFRQGRPTLSLWAPTAHDVRLELYADSAPATRPRLLPMAYDRASGVWHVTGEPSWRGAYYRYRVTVWAPSVAKVVVNEVTDPYSLSLSTDSKRSQIADLSDPALAPAGWSGDRAPAAVPAGRQEIQELHVRDFSIADTTVPAAERGTYLAFTRRNSAGMRHLRQLAAAGVTTVHLLPAFDFAGVPERRADQAVPGCDLASYAPDSDRQQACVARTAARDGYNWGYNPYHFTVPEGSYATDPDGTERIRQFRAMVAALHRAGLRVVMDVVYNHTAASGQADTSVLDRIVPGYYQRLSDGGQVTTDSCCSDTAPEHAMMNRLVVDSVSTWARAYHVDGFRFDLMGLDPKSTMLDVQAAVERIRPGSYLYGEGWNFGVVANDARFVQATQANMAGTGIGTFNDRLRDAVRGGSPFDADPRVQGFASGLSTDPNASPANGTPAQQIATLRHEQDLIEVGLTGNLRDFTFTDSAGQRVKGSQIDYGGAPAGYTAAPSEAVTYVDAHDNLDLYDAFAYKLPAGTSMADRVRAQTVALATTALAQGPGFAQAGTDLLRSKSLDANSYDSGDWFNAIHWDCRDGNGFGHGLPPAADNRAAWPYARPLLADAALVPGCGDTERSTRAYQDLLRIKRSSPLLDLPTLQQVQRRLTFPLSGPGATPGVITMHLDGTGLPGAQKSLTVILNATAATAQQTVTAFAGTRQTLHPVQAAGADPVVKRSAFDPATGTFTVPGRTVAVFVQE